VNLKTNKIIGLNSHDYHIMMERLLNIMFRVYFKVSIWKALAELSYFYRQLCANEIKINNICNAGQINFLAG
jgi:hypothetical protein